MHRCHPQQPPPAAWLACRGASHWSSVGSACWPCEVAGLAYARSRHLHFCTCWAARQRPLQLSAVAWCAAANVGTMQPCSVCNILQERCSREVCCMKERRALHTRWAPAPRPGGRGVPPGMIGVSERRYRAFDWFSDHLHTGSRLLSSARQQTRRRATPRPSLAPPAPCPTP